MTIKAANSAPFGSYGRPLWLSSILPPMYITFWVRAENEKWGEEKIIKGRCQQMGLFAVTKHLREMRVSFLTILLFRTGFLRVGYLLSSMPRTKRFSSGEEGFRAERLPDVVCGADGVVTVQAAIKKVYPLCSAAVTWGNSAEAFISGLSISPCRDRWV